MADLSVQNLMDQLDPERVYDRPFPELLEAVRAGALLLSPGAGGHPVIQEAVSGTFIKGTGRRVGSQEYKYNAQEVARLLSAHLPEVMPVFLEELLTKRDPRMFDTYFKRVAGNAGQPFGGMAADEVVELMQKIAGMSEAVPVKPTPIEVEFGA